jgi:hypothetical protein
MTSSSPIASGFVNRLPFRFHVKLDTIPPSFPTLYHERTICLSNLTHPSTSPAATTTALPPELPPALRSPCPHGLTTRSSFLVFTVILPIPNSSILVLPFTLHPAFSRWVTAVAVNGGKKSWSICESHSVGIGVEVLRQRMLSLMPTAPFRCAVIGVLVHAAQALWVLFIVTAEGKVQTNIRGGHRSIHQLSAFEFILSALEFASAPTAI